MLAYNPATGESDIDPHYLSILPLKAVWDADTTKGKKIGRARLMWLYHRFNPHSAYKDYRQSDKSVDIARDLFPKDYLKQKQKDLAALLEAKNDNVETTKQLWSPELDADMEAAIAWYKNHLTRTPLWFAVESYTQAMYNLSQKMRDAGSSPSEIRTASQELDTLPVKREKMRQQAEKDEANMVKVQGDKNIKRGERRPEERQRGAHKVG